MSLFPLTGLPWFLLGKGSPLCRFGTRHFGAKVPKAPGFRFPGPQNDSGLAPRPLPLSYLSFLVLLLPLIEEKIDSFHIKHLLRMPSSLRGSHVRGGTLEGKCRFFR